MEPELVTQEIWGHLCCHYAIRWLMFEAAEHAGHDPTGSPSSPRCGSPGAPSPNRALFPPEGTDTIARLWAHAIGELVRRLLPKRGPRANPRVVKRKYAKWHVKRVRHHAWPQPHRLPDQAVMI